MSPPLRPVGDVRVEFIPAPAAMAPARSAGGTEPSGRRTLRPRVGDRVGERAEGTRAMSRSPLRTGDVGDTACPIARMRSRASAGTEMVVFARCKVGRSTSGTVGPVHTVNNGCDSLGSHSRSVTATVTARVKDGPAGTSSRTVFDGEMPCFIRVTPVKVVYASLASEVATSFCGTNSVRLPCVDHVIAHSPPCPCSLLPERS